jgi:hypothetical protein
MDSTASDRQPAGGWRRFAACRMSSNPHVSVTIALIQGSRKTMKSSSSGKAQERLQIAPGCDKDSGDRFLTNNPEAVERWPCFEDFHPCR